MSLRTSCCNGRSATSADRDEVRTVSSVVKDVWLNRWDMRSAIGYDVWGHTLVWCNSAGQIEVAYSGVHFEMAHEVAEELRKIYGERVVGPEIPLEKIGKYSAVKDIAEMIQGLRDRQYDYRKIDPCEIESYINALDKIVMTAIERMDKMQELAENRLRIGWSRRNRIQKMLFRMLLYSLTYTKRNLNIMRKTLALCKESIKEQTKTNSNTAYASMIPVYLIKSADVGLTEDEWCLLRLASESVCDDYCWSLEWDTVIYPEAIVRMHNEEEWNNARWATGTWEVWNTHESRQDLEIWGNWNVKMQKDSRRPKNIFVGRPRKDGSYLLCSIETWDISPWTRDSSIAKPDY